VPKSSAVTPWAQPCTDSAPAIRTNSTQGNIDRIGRNPSSRIRRPRGERITPGGRARVRQCVPVPPHVPSD
jgi:hypothetical protein